MKEILLIIDNFPPDLGAASFRFESIVKKLLNENIKVKVLCSYPNRIEMGKIQELDFQNLEIVRISRKESLKPNIFSRAITYFEFFCEALKLGKKISKEVDLIIATSPQLLVGISGSILAKLNKKIFLLDIRDLWPDIVVDMGVMKKYNPIYLCLKLAEIFMYKTANFIVYNSPAFKEHLEKYNKNKPLKLITNGIDEYILNFFESSKEKIRSESFSIKSKYKMMYAGNLGIAQDIIILTELALRYPEELEIVLIGKGSQEKKIKETILKKNIKNIIMLDSIPRKELLNKYLEADILFLQLKNIKMFEKTIPSKIFEYMAADKPIIYGVEGIAKKILFEDFNQKYYFKCNDIDDLCRIFEEVKKDLKCNNYSRINFEKLKEKYSRDKLSEEYVKIILELLSNKEKNYVKEIL